MKRIAYMSCPKCGNRTRFKLILERVVTDEEEHMEYEVMCECGHLTGEVFKTSQDEVDNFQDGYGLLNADIMWETWDKPLYEASKENGKTKDWPSSIKEILDKKAISNGSFGEVCGYDMADDMPIMAVTSGGEGLVGLAGCSDWRILEEYKNNGMGYWFITEGDVIDE